MVHGLFGAFADAFAAFDAELVVNDGIAFGVLRDGADGADFDQGTDVVVGTDVFIYLYHVVYVVYYFLQI